MVLSNTQQTQVLLFSLLFGLGLGAWFDVFRVFRCFVRCSAVTVLFQDLICFFVAAVASFLFIFEVNDGTVRLFILVAFSMGALVFRCTAGQLLLWFCRRAKRYFRMRKEHPDPHNTTTEQKKSEG